MTVAVLFARRDSHYKALPGTDVYDEDRDARTWPGGARVVAHPPCRGWGRLRQFAKLQPHELSLAIGAVWHVREFGGVLEHPKASTLWAYMGLPRPGQRPDRWGGWTLEVNQFHWGHRALKPTWLYIVGVNDWELPPLPRREGSPTHCIAPTRTPGAVRLPTVTKREREETPPEFAAWLLEVARRARAA